MCPADTADRTNNYHRACNSNVWKKMTVSNELRMTRRYYTISMLIATILKTWSDVSREGERERGLNPSFMKRIYNLNQLHKFVQICLNY